MSGEGWGAVPNWIIRDGGIPPMSKVVLLVISSHIGREGSWFMGHAKIAEEAGISVSSVKRALVDLRDRGLLSWVERTREGERLENLYTVTMSVPTDLTPVHTEPGVGSVRTEGGVSQSEQKNTPRTPPRTPEGGAARGTRITDDFASTLTPAEIAWARTECPLVDGRSETEQFVDYWAAASGTNSRKVDWHRAWKVWMRRAQRDAASRPAARRAQTQQTAIATVERNQVTPEMVAAREAEMAAARSRR